MIPSRPFPALLAAALAAAPLALSPVTAAAQAAEAPASAASLFPSTADLQQMLDYLVEDGATPGIVLGIVEPDGSTRILQAGTAGEGARPLGPNTVFEIGSINKTFTGTVLADMVARGEVALDDPVRTYLPDSVRVPTRNGREITLLDLATHRSGLPRMPANFVPADTGNPYADYDAAVIYEFLDGHELRRDIGAEYEYSNLGMGLLGHALGRAAGMPFAELVRTRVLEPLGMRTTGYVREGEVAAWHAKGHEDGEVVPHWDAGDAIAGAGGLRSNIVDMLTYLRAQMGPADTELERAMRMAHRPWQDFGDRRFGLAWAIRSTDGRTILSHGGSTGGFSTMIGFDPERRTGFVMLTNTGEFPDDVAMDFLVRGAPLAIPVVDVPRGVLATYVGEYEFAPGRAAVVRREDDGTMTIRVGGNVRFQMFADSDSTFYLRRAPWRVAFTRDASGAVTGLTLDAGRGAEPARKVSDEAPLPGTVRDLPVTTAEMEGYAGTYALRMGERTMPLRVYVEEGTLMVQPGGQTPTRLLAQGRHVFIPDAAREIRLVFTVEDGRATQVVMLQGGRQAVGPRTP